MYRLEQALALLGYGKPLAPYHRNNLIAAIAQFALVNEDTELEEACKRELENILASIPPNQRA